MFGIAGALIVSSIISGIFTKYAADKSRRAAEAASQQAINASNQATADQQAAQAQGDAAMAAAIAQANAMAAQAQAAAARAMAQQNAINLEALDFAKAEYANWEKIYGPILSNLSHFYQNLSGDTLIASGLDKYELQYNQIQSNIQKSFAQRGIDSPAKEALVMQSALQKAGYVAKLRNEAPLKAAAAKQSFLTANVTNPFSNTISNAYNNEAVGYGQQAGIYAGEGNVAQGAANQYTSDQIRNYYNRSANFANNANQYDQQAIGFRNQANQATITGYNAVGNLIQTGIAAYVQNQTYQNYLDQNALNQNSMYGPITSPYRRAGQ